MVKGDADNVVNPCSNTPKIHQFCITKRCVWVVGEGGGVRAGSGVGSGRNDYVKTIYSLLL